MGKAAKRRRAASQARAATERPATDSSRAVSNEPGWIGLSIGGFLLVSFLALKCFALHPERVDEGIYFYGAVRLAEGARLYRDLFFAHPPLHLLVPALLVKLLGYHFNLLKAIPQLAGAAQGVLAFVVARRVWKSDLAACVAMAALFLSSDFLKATSFFTGINLADALLFAGVVAALYRRPLVAGILAGASTMTLLQTAPMALVLGISLWIFDRASGRRFVVGGAATVALLHVVGFAYGGSAFIEQVYLYHLHKVGSDGAGVTTLGMLYADDLALFVGGTFALALSFTRLDPRPEARQLGRALALAVLAQFVAMGTRPAVFPFYFQPAFVPLALALGWAVSLGVARLRGERTASGRALGAAIVVGVAVAPTLLTWPITDLVSPQRAAQRASYSQRYVWQDAPFIGALNGVVRALLWENGERAAGSWHLGPTEYLWNQSRGFDSYSAIVDEVRRSSPPEGTLFGDSGSVPLVALGANRRVALDLADTNAQRFVSGTTPPATTIVALEELGGPTLVLASRHAGVFSLPEFASWLDEKYSPLREFSDTSGTPYTLYRRR